MNDLNELKAMRDALKQTVDISDSEEHQMRVLVGMATCGIAAGAAPVLTALTEEVAKRSLSGVTVKQTGCIGICQYEPVVEIHETGKEKVTYVNMTPEKIVNVVSSHIVNNCIVEEYTIGNYA